MLTEKFDEWKEEFINQGKAKGLANQKNTLLEMLSDRFGDVPANWKEIILKLQDSDSISQLTRAILKVDTLEDYDALLIEKALLQ